MGDPGGGGSGEQAANRRRVGAGSLEAVAMAPQNRPNTHTRTRPELWQRKPAGTANCAHSPSRRLSAALPPPAGRGRARVAGIPAQGGLGAGWEDAGWAAAVPLPPSGARAPRGPPGLCGTDTSCGCRPALRLAARPGPALEESHSWPVPQPLPEATGVPPPVHSHSPTLTSSPPSDPDTQRTFS